MIRDFLNAYIKNIMEAKNIDFETRDLTDIVDDVLNDDYIWDNLDNSIIEKIEKYDLSNYNNEMEKK